MRTNKMLAENGTLMQKQIWEITERDIEICPAWVFPMSEDDNRDGATVIPATKEDLEDPNSLVIVGCEAKDSKGERYKGYMYWAIPVCIERCQPLIWVGDKAVGFWFGIQKPETSDYPELNFPLTCRTKKIGRLESIDLLVNGFGYVSGNRTVFIS